MDKTIETVFKSFESFIKRALVPSSTFLLVAASLYLIFGCFYDGKYIEWLNTLPKLEWYVYLMIFVGLSYVLAILQQATIDNFIKGNYSEDTELMNLRNKVITLIKETSKFEKSQIDESMFTDYFLYQIVGTCQESIKSYADEAKAIGILTISLIINLFITSCLIGKGLVNTCFESFILTLVVCSFICGLVWCLGFYLTKQRYKARAIRIYTNYLYSNLQPKTIKCDDKESPTKTTTA